MLLYLMITVALQLTTIQGGLLDDCGIDSEQRVDNDLVIDVLEDFYKDLIFVQASTETRQDRNYSGLTQEIHNNYGLESLPWISDNVYQFFYWIIHLLRQNRIEDAKSELSTLRSYDYVDGGKEMSYLCYLEAEANRLLGENPAASSSVLSAYLERREAPGVTLNELERLDGLISLQKVSEFSLNVDRYYGVGRSPDYHLLSILNSTLGSEMAPLNEIRFTALDRLYDTSPRIETAADASTSEGREAAVFADMQRVNPELDDFSGRSVSHASTKEILCEFAHKLHILGVSSRKDTSADHRAVIEQLRRIDPNFAERLNARVVAFLPTNLELAKENLRGIWTNDLRLARYNRIQQLFTRYFTAELHRLKMGDGCSLDDLNDLHDNFVTTKHVRKMYLGVSIARLIDLEARVALLWLKCFHERVKLAYDLAGNENEQQLEAKRVQLGTGRNRIIPDSIIFRRPAVP